MTRAARQKLWSTMAATSVGAGRALSHLPYPLKKYVATRRWHYLPARLSVFSARTFEEMLKNETRNLLVYRPIPATGGHARRYFLELNLKHYVDRRCYFLDEDAWLEKFIVQNLTAQDTYFDIGANIGLTTLLAAQVAGKIYAFEPEPRAYSRLQAHIRLNKLTNTEAYQLAISNREGSAALYQCINNDGSHSMDQEFMATIGNTYAAPIVVPTQPLNSLSLPMPTLVKIDVEGHEQAVLEGMTNYLPGTKYVILETTPTRFTAIREYLERYGFTSWYIFSGDSAEPMEERFPSSQRQRLLNVLAVNERFDIPHLGQ